MTVSIVVPAYNEAKLIRRSLDAIREAITAFQRRAWTAEIIVCDNHSTDPTAELAHDAGATVVFEPINQISRARNRGAAAATGDWLIFVDADSYPSTALFLEVARAIESGRYLGGGALVRMEHVRGLGWILNRGWNLISRLSGWAAGSFVFCEASAFRELRGFSEELYASEEIDFSRRLRRLARSRNRRTVILTRHPLLTSARKLELCSWLDYLKLLGQTLWQGGSNLRRRDACGIWYNGRR